MKYNNPVIKGFYPDPSVCKVENTYYLVCSSFQYFPGVPIFESKDLINWKQIGHCLTRRSQIELEKINSSGGIFAPTIRFNNGRFYMTTTNNSTQENFYVWTDDIYGEWSEPIYVKQGGIDPSLYFEDDKAYFMSSGTDDNGVDGIVQCEIDIQTGRKLTPSLVIWTGSGGRFLEGPHMYKINGMYYLVAAEGGTEFGHMVTYARGNSPYATFEEYSHNPVLTNRNLGGHEIQGVGHGDLVQDNMGNWWILHLGFRQSGQWQAYHHLGREVFLTPVTFYEDGWFKAGENGTTIKCFETDKIPNSVVQNEKKCYTFENTKWDREGCYLRIPHGENYKIKENSISLKGTNITLDEADSPTFIGLRQKDFNMYISCDVSISDGEAGITLYMDENHHYDLALCKYDNKYEVIVKLNVGEIKHVKKSVCLENDNKVSLIIHADNNCYNFCIKTEDKEVNLGRAQTKYLSSEVAGGFTGVIIGLYACGLSGYNYAEFTNFKCDYF
ncbi:glycoside hydrolase family 43 protein [Clostridium beijerinckii]|uniref:glycoside hydrolase family 43 protein n=1 Tax=Clostridium beijerinckii TaxID=1520 RepID=UPI0014944552|nr:glycoside hydrolase family 43 protein [Clostridium beijerinckii]NOW06697.1 alpha-N-arabinofuranosidase [Clostridium beijerinckii]NYC00158.1 alpha-N-arabinofuranosidase [Clostridium beijerinckii]